MKKIFYLAAIYLSFSLSVYASNYTLQASPSGTEIYSKGTSVVNSKKFPSTPTGAFCSGMSDFFSSSFVPVSSSSFSSVRYTGAGNLLFASSHRDPYLIEINGSRYMMIKDNQDGVFNQDDILGINDTPQTIFASLIPLDVNADKKLTGEELSNANIRLVKINSDGKLLLNDNTQDFKNSDIVFIYLTEIRKSYKNDGISGDFGLFDVLIKDDRGLKKLVAGVVTFEANDEINKYFE